MRQKELGIYVHIPFCAKKCYYCDFISFPNKKEMIKDYIEALKKEIEYVRIDALNSIENPEITTIYIGGGTPSFIESKYIVDIIKTIKENFVICKEAEITLEVNPGTVTKEKLQVYKKSGVNRLSIGLQSTNNNLLKQIGRIHTYEQFIDTYNLARGVGFKNINVDLMLALPNQTINVLEDSVQKVIDLKPEHISVYSLILEAGTKLYDLVKNKELNLLDDELEREMYWKVKKKLEQSGYNHYEISNYAKYGCESKHNMNCWEQEEYIGIGLAAHSYVNGIRYSNTEDIDEYINTYKLGKNVKDIITIHEKQNSIDKQKEYMILGLRKIEGVKISSFKNRFNR
ncbi:MAG: radical SAM family heme chaperone HemW [Clostridia bacterium]|nr:radical SAM family heme chaperone HemW [Clostridia bacterium]